MRLMPFLVVLTLVTIIAGAVGFWNGMSLGMVAILCIAIFFLGQILYVGLVAIMTREETVRRKNQGPAQAGREASDDNTTSHVSRGAYLNQENR
ncbi:hypothetical protein [Thioclava electrotropha]|uniref:Exopolysaccharide production repressor exox n=1 Tax=Thioclava electrotropha TaxID=1549850 RepID=A0ABX6YWS3_9RHOB|nr:hypothetical protein [Thioclava electrotropha]QPZ92225.1 hypothetical protein AKL02_015895 [Thioclava electrotropha]